MYEKAVTWMNSMKITCINIHMKITTIGVGVSALYCWTLRI